jgi:hypothetical protein
MKSIIISALLAMILGMHTTRTMDVFARTFHTNQWVQENAARARNNEVINFINSLGDSINYNFYDILDLASDATPALIRKAYYSLSLIYHADKTTAPHAPDMMAKINQSYEVLSNPDKRQIYDFCLQLDTITQIRSSDTKRRTFRQLAENVRRYNQIYDLQRCVKNALQAADTNTLTTALTELRALGAALPHDLLDTIVLESCKPGDKTLLVARLGLIMQQYPAWISNSRDPNGNTLLHIFAHQGYHQGVQFIITTIPNSERLLSITNHMRQTPLACAVETFIQSARNS